MKLFWASLSHTGRYQLLKSSFVSPGNTRLKEHFTNKEYGYLVINSPVLTYSYLLLYLLKTRYENIHAKKQK